MSAQKPSSHPRHSHRRKSRAAAHRKILNSPWHPRRHKWGVLLPHLSIGKNSRGIDTCCRSWTKRVRVETNPYGAGWNRRRRR